MSVDAGIVFFPRLTTLVAHGSGVVFATLPIDVSQYAGVQLQICLYPVRSYGTPSIYARFSESLDTENWVLGPSTPEDYLLTPGGVRFFSYGFRLRWFRLELLVTGNDVIATVWADGLLRGGGGGAWARPSPVPMDEAARGLVPPPMEPGRVPPDFSMRNQFVNPPTPAQAPPGLMPRSGGF